MKHSNEYEMAWIACQDAVHCIEPSQMQVIESSKKIICSFCTDFPVDSAGGMLVGEVPQHNLLFVAAHIMYKRVSGPHCRHNNTFNVVNLRFNLSNL
jgi:hypothetical protein